MDEPVRLAKISWDDPENGIPKEFFLLEGATASIGRSSNNDICIPDKHVSRQHAVITYREGLFVISDLKSANGTFVNDLHLSEPYPLASGDMIRLYVPVIMFSSVKSEEESRRARLTQTLISQTMSTGKGKLIITGGPQEGHVIPLLLQKITIGRATSNATWEIGLQDPSVSRPHAVLEREETHWRLRDLGSSNGTYLNDKPVQSNGELLRDGDRIMFGATSVLYRAG